MRIKYFDLQEPEYDHMVFINRREGLVPLSSLCQDDVKSVMSSNVKLLKGRNVRLGKPRIFVKDNGRLVAVGGSRGEIFIETIALSFYRSQNVLGWSKFFVLEQKIICVLWQSQNFCARQKDDLFVCLFCYYPKHT